MALDHVSVFIWNWKKTKSIGQHCNALHSSLPGEEYDTSGGVVGSLYDTVIESRWSAAAAARRVLGHMAHLAQQLSQ